MTGSFLGPPCTELQNEHASVLESVQNAYLNWLQAISGVGSITPLTLSLALILSLSLFPSLTISLLSQREWFIGAGLPELNPFLHYVNPLMRNAMSDPDKGKPASPGPEGLHTGLNWAFKYSPQAVLDQTHAHTWTDRQTDRHAHTPEVERVLQALYWSMNIGVSTRPSLGLRCLSPCLSSTSRLINEGSSVTSVIHPTVECISILHKT